MSTLHEAVFFKTQAYICNGVNPSGGYLKDIVKGSDFWNFLNTKVILCKITTVREWVEVVVVIC